MGPGPGDSRISAPPRPQCWLRRGRQSCGAFPRPHPVRLALLARAPVPLPSVPASVCWGSPHLSTSLPPTPPGSPLPRSKDFSLTRGAKKVTRGRTGRGGWGEHDPPDRHCRGICCPPRGQAEGAPPQLSRGGARPAEGGTAKVPELPAAAAGSPSPGRQGEGSQSRARLGPRGASLGARGEGRPRLPRDRRPYLRPWRDQPGCTPPAAAVGPGSALADRSGFLVRAARPVNH